MPFGGFSIFLSVITEYNAPTQAPRFPSQNSGFGSILKWNKGFELIEIHFLRVKLLTKIFPTYQRLWLPPNIHQRDSIHSQLAEAK